MASTSNHDVLGLDNRIGRFIKEVQDSGSGNWSQYSEADKARLKTYTNATLVYIDWVTAQPILDLPETFPTAYEFDPVLPAKKLENEMVNDIQNILLAAQTEIRDSQSASAPCNYLNHDVIRWRMVVEKVDSYIDNYANTVTPLDLPESSPMNAGVTPGLKGTHQK